MFKRVLTIVLFVVALAAAVLFTAMNPGEVDLELGFVLWRVPLGLAFILAIALGWVLGLLSMLPRVLRLVNQRRRLRHESQQAGGGLVIDERG